MSEEGLVYITNFTLADSSLNLAANRERQRQKKV